jgi:hypothetical protein
MLEGDCSGFAEILGHSIAQDNIAVLSKESADGGRVSQGKGEITVGKRAIQAEMLQMNPLPEYMLLLWG